MKSGSVIFNKLLIESEHLTVKRQRELTQNFGVQHYGDIDQTIKELRNIKTNPKLKIFAKRQSSLTNASKLVPNSLKSV